MEAERKSICPICGAHHVDIRYDDYIRDGAPGTLTKEKYQMFYCPSCGVTWHHLDAKENRDFYGSEAYRNKLEHTAKISDYYRLHDSEVLDKLNYTGTDIFRGTVVCDIGCGGGSFLDFISGAASEVIAIEPAEHYRKELRQRGYKTYAYSQEADECSGGVDVVTSFDVIEHADNPIEFMREIYRLLKPQGRAIIGTPSDCPIMRVLLGHEYEQKLLYSFQHPWILSAKSFRLCCEQAGFREIRIVPKQRYGLANLVQWLKERRPTGHCEMQWVSETLDDVYKAETEAAGLADYLLAYVVKQ